MENTKIKSLLDVMSKEQPIFTRLKIGELHSGDSVNKSHLEYSHLLELLDNPIDSEFYKSSWVNIVKDGYVFIDIAKEEWSIFECHYNCSGDNPKNHYWYKEHLFTGLDDLMQNLGEFEYLKSVRNQNRDSRRNDVDDWLDELVK